MVLPQLPPAHKMSQSSKTQEIIHRVFCPATITSTHAVNILSSLPQGFKEKGKLRMNASRVDETSQCYLAPLNAEWAGNAFVLCQIPAHTSTPPPTHAPAAQLALEQPCLRSPLLPPSPAAAEKQGREVPLNPAPCKSTPGPPSSAASPRSQLDSSFHSSLFCLSF